MVIVLLASPAAVGESKDFVYKEKYLKAPTIIVISLKANKTTGFKWFYKIEDKEIMEVIYDKYVAEKNEKGVLGRGGKHYWYLLVKEKGNSEISFQLKKSWQPENIKKEVVYNIISS